MSNDRQMDRSVSQAMYRYLPGRWVDFYIKSSRTSYSAFVANWNSTPQTDINVGRIKREVWHRLEGVQSYSVGFAPLREDSAWSVMTPKVNDLNSAVVANVSPLLFACSNPSCRRVQQFYSSAEYLKDSRNLECRHCGKPLVQIRLIYYCDCGWAGPVEVKPCKNGCRKPFRQKGSYQLICEGCGEVQEIERFCPEEGCHAFLRPHNALDNAQFYPQSFNLIDLVDIKREQFVSADNIGGYIAIAYYLGFISKDRFERLVQNGTYKEDEAEKEAIIQRNIVLLKSMILGLPEDIYRMNAEKVYQENNTNRDISQAISTVKNYVMFSDENTLRSVALSILEYDTVLHSTETRTLEEAANTAIMLNEIDTTDIYQAAAKSLHFSSVQASGHVPFVTAVYGYTRKGNVAGPDEGANVIKVRAFARESNVRSNIYVTRMETEGILFEFDKRAILQWLIKNGDIAPENYSPDMEDVELKAWFLKECNAPIPFYDEIGEEHPIQKKVYGLIHSVSHMLIKQAEAFSGLDKNSLAEYIFPTIPAVFIYCQNSQGFSLGALFSALESKFDAWMKTVKHEARQCIFDPICLNEKGACNGCLHLGDISCRHFNRDLDRRLMVGYNDAVTGEHTFGFWED